MVVYEFMLKDRRNGKEHIQINKGLSPGEKQTFENRGHYVDDDHAIFHWTEGNFECDCNRSLFMYDHDASEELKCNTSDNDRVIDLLWIKKDGVVIWRNK